MTLRLWSVRLLASLSVRQGEGAQDVCAAHERLAVGEWGVVDGTGQHVTRAERRQGEVRAVLGSDSR